MTWLRSRRGPAWATVLAILGLAATLGAWLWPRPPAIGGEEASVPTLYVVRIQTVDSEGQPVPASSVRISTGNEAQRLADGWWEMEVPAAKVPGDGRITVWAAGEDGAAGREQLILGVDPNVGLELRLEPPQSRVVGRVLGPGGGAVAGSRVIPVSSAAKAVFADAEGMFELVLPVRSDARVRLRAEAAGFLPAETFCYTGRQDCSIQLER